VVLSDGPILCGARRRGDWGTVELLGPASFLERFDPVIEGPLEPREMIAPS
jgi:hypothetical protein